MGRTVWKWVALGIVGVLVVNLANIVSAFSFGTQDILVLVVFMAAFYSCLVLFSARILYLRENRKMAQVTSRPPPIGKKGDKTIIYGTDQQGTLGGAAITLPTGEMRCTKCGVTNPPNSKKCKNCDQTF